MVDVKTQELREKIARAVDPEAWKPVDAACSKDRRPMSESQTERANASLDRADRILAIPEIASALKLASQATGWSFPIKYMVEDIDKG